MSDNYRDGCSKKWTLGWFTVQMIYLGAWLSTIGRKK